MMIRCVIFDFDGTIKQSIAIKHEAYFSAVQDIPRGDEILRAIISEFPSMTRYSGCDLFAERAHAMGIDTPSGAELAERYTVACEDAIAACPEVPGAFAFLNWLCDRDVDCFVVSGTPQTPMRETVRRIQLWDHFRDVFGSPTDKPTHYAHILSKNGFASAEVLVIGDGDDDKAAAESAGASFVRVAGGAGTPQDNEIIVTALTEIRERPEFEFPSN